jgi:hypothetical protein
LHRGTDFLNHRYSLFDNRNLLIGAGTLLRYRTLEFSRNAVECRNHLGNLGEKSLKICALLLLGGDPVLDFPVSVFQGLAGLAFTINHRLESVRIN